MIIPQDEEPV